MIEDSLGLAGTTVADKYEVIEAVGKGGFAVVYRARHLLWKRPVALKVFKALDVASAAERQQLTDDLIREASVLAELSEKTASICQARDLGMLTTPSGNALPYMVLEWLEGQSLAEILAGEQRAALPPRSLAASVTLLDPIAEALAVAHARGIAHRDVKPANVFVATDGEGKTVSVKLLDFGIAKVVQDAQRTGGAFEKTAGLVTAFTPSYGAPEQFSRKFGATGPWTDVFALALVVVECCAGRRIVQGGDLVEMARMATDPTRRPTPRSMGVLVSDEAEAVFARALAVQPAERFPTAGDFWIALARTLGLEPSRALVAANQSRDGDLFQGIASAATAPAPSGPSPPAPGSRARVSGLPPGPRASGKRVLVGLAAFGVVFVAMMAAGVLYDKRHRTNEPPSAPSGGPPSLAVARASAPLATPPPAASAKADPCPSGMVLIPGGEFFMGSDEDGEAEKPAHHVELSPYCIDAYEVTVARYAACSDEGKCKRASRTNEWPGITAHEREVFDPLCSMSEGADAHPRHPVVCVDWSMASAFCATLPGGRLPTEAEWEFAARGPDGRRYPWGDEPPGPLTVNACGAECVAWAKEKKVPMTAMYAGDDGWPTTAEVGSFPKGRSRFGLYDVAGNVWEWVADWQGPYGKASQKDPRGPETGKLKVIRGGAWNGSVDAWERPTFRFMNGPENRSYGIGFRCAATPR
jgi:formylglycine-generating enzyme required for sulfatase activity/serine/threonine protein kinase